MILRDFRIQRSRSPESVLLPALCAFSAMACACAESPAADAAAPCEAGSAACAGDGARVRAAAAAPGGAGGGRQELGGRTDGSTPCEGVRNATELRGPDVRGEIRVYGSCGAPAAPERLLPWTRSMVSGTPRQGQRPALLHLPVDRAVRIRRGGQARPGTARRPTTAPRV